MSAARIFAVQALVFAILATAFAAPFSNIYAVLACVSLALAGLIAWGEQR